MTQSRIKYYGTLAATFFVLLLSTEHISSALRVVENMDSKIAYFMTWFAAAGIQVFEVLTAVGLADVLMRRQRNTIVMGLLIVILLLFFGANLGGNVLYAMSNMMQIGGRSLTLSKINALDNLQRFWIIWAAVPIPLMGLAGVTVMSIFRRELQEAIIENKKLEKEALKEIERQQAREEANEKRRQRAEEKRSRQQKKTERTVKAPDVKAKVKEEPEIEDVFADVRNEQKTPLPIADEYDQNIRTL